MISSMPRPADDAKLIDLAYAASFVVLADAAQRPWGEAIGDIVPGELEKECYELATEFGLQPIREIGTLEEIEVRWHRQLRSVRQQEIFHLGMLLMRQHGCMSYLQVHPEAEERMEVCFRLDVIQDSLKALFKKYRLDGSMAKLPYVPMPGSPTADWMDWSGDALRESVMAELGGSK